MKGDTQIHNCLNQVLYDQLSAINQYFLHARIFKNWGLKRLNDADYEASIRAMKDADDLVERILFLEGLPNLQDIGKLLLGETPREMLACNLKLEQNTLPALRAAIAQCESAGDFVTRELLERIVGHQEARLDHYETQLELIDKLGLENYLQSQVEE